MSRVYDTIEPTVVDDSLLRSSVYEQGPSAEAGAIAKEEGIDFGDVSQLRLDFKNILKIDNLWSFTSLTKLQLDNNIIETVSGLDELVNLVWLDLSFNNIERIAGLDRLVRLQDLSLFHNRISVIENMDSLVELHVLSIGSNCLENLENLVYLRRFASLQALSVAGNPFCEDRRYKNFTLAHVSSLKYLDFQLILDDERARATEEYRDAIDQILHREKEESQSRETTSEKMKELELHKAAYVNGMFGTVLFDSMYEEDQDSSKLHQMPGVEEMVTQFREKFVAVCDDLAALGLKEYERRQTESDDFFTCIADAKQQNKDQGVKLIDKFVNFKKRVMKELMMIFDTDAQDAKIATMRGELSDLKHELLLLEMQLVDQLEEVDKDFERNMTEMVTGFIEGAQQRFTQCRDFENLHHEKLTELAMQLLEERAKGELEEELPDELRMLFVDKDTIANAINSSHDAHILTIDNKEDSIISRARGELNALVERVHRTEAERNRARIAEVLSFVSHHGDDIDACEDTARDAQS